MAIAANENKTVVLLPSRSDTRLAVRLPVRAPTVLTETAGKRTAVER